MDGRTRLAIAVVLGLTVGAVGRQLTNSPRLQSSNLAGEAPATASRDGQRAAPRRSAMAERPSLEAVLAARGFEQRLLASTYLKEATTDEVLALVELLLAPDASKIWPIAALIYRRGLELDPQAITTLVSENDERGYRTSSLFREWAKLDPEAALAASKGLSDQIRSSVVAAIGETNPQRALAILDEEKLGKSYIKERLEAKQLAQLMETDIEGAIEQALGLSSRRARLQALNTVLRGWSKKDAKAALSWLQTQETLPDKIELLSNVLPALAEQHSQQVQDILNTMPMNAKRGKLESKVLGRLAKDNFQSALKTLRNYPTGPYRDFLFEQIIDEKNPPDNLLDLVRELDIDVKRAGELTGLQIRMKQGGSSFGGGSNGLRRALETTLTKVAEEESPQAAMRLALETFGTDRRAFLSIADSLSTSWADKDPAAAARWAMSLPDGEISRALQSSSLKRWGASDPVAAGELLVDTGNEANFAIVDQLLRNWGKQDPASLLEWTETVPAANHDEVLSLAIRRVAEHDVQMAIPHIENISSLDNQQKAVQNVGKLWADQAPQEALAWLHGQPENINVQSTLKSQSKAWVLKDPLVASQWIGDLEQGPRRDHAVAGMVHALVSSHNPQRDFVAASAWVQTIESPALRDEWLGEIQERQAKEPPAAPASEPAVSVEMIGGSIQITP